jgi:hypothetical protein
MQGVTNQISFSLFLGAFAKLPKATVSFVMSVRPCGRLQQLGFHGMDFDEFMFEFCQKCRGNVQVSLKSDKNNDYFTF